MVVYEKQKKILKLFVRDFDKYVENDDMEGLGHETAIIIMRYGYNYEKGRKNFIGRIVDKTYNEIRIQNRKE